jgi:hypothetical protein
MDKNMTDKMFHRVIEEYFRGITETLRKVLERYSAEILGAIEDRFHIKYLSAS